MSGYRERGDRRLTAGREAKVAEEARALRAEALEAFERAVARARQAKLPSEVLRDAVFDRGRAHDTTRGYAEAVADFREAIALGRQRTDDWLFWSSNRLGEQMRDRGRPVEGLLTIWRNFLDLTPDLGNRIGIRSLRATWAMRHAIGSLSGELSLKEGTAAPTDCDRLASHRNDTMRIAPWVDFDAIDPERALPACQQAVAQFPDEPRYLFLRGRVNDRAARMARDSGSGNAARASDAAAVADYTSAMNRGYVWAFNNYAGLVEDGQGVPKDEERAADINLENFNRLMQCCWTRVARHLLEEEAKHDVAQVRRVVRELTRWSAALGSAPSRDLIAELTEKGVLPPETPLPAAALNALPPWLRFR